MANSTCSVEGCEIPPLARGWCNGHLKRWQRYGNPEFYPIRTKPVVKCSIDECENVGTQRGWCGTHYRRWRKHGDVSFSAYNRKPPGQCAAEKCSKNRSTSGYCFSHTSHEKPQSRRRELASTPGECLRCGVEVARVPGKRVADYCRPCMKTRSAEASSARQAALRDQKAATEELRCEDCGAKLPPRGSRNAVSPRCEDCREEHLKRVRAAAYLRFRERHPLPDHFICSQCHGEIPRSEAARCNPSWCKSCRTMNCSNCGDTFLNRSVSAKHSSLCPTCQEEEEKARQVEWRKNNPKRLLNLGHRRRAKLRGSPRENFLLEDVYARDRWTCGICKKKIRKKLKYPHPMSVSLDHIIPISHGGGHVKANVRATHLTCNVSRGNRGGNEQLLLIG